MDIVKITEFRVLFFRIDGTKLFWLNRDARKFDTRLIVSCTYLTVNKNKC